MGAAIFGFPSWLFPQTKTNFNSWRKVQRWPRPKKKQRGCKRHASRYRKAGRDEYTIRFFLEKMNRQQLELMKGERT